MVYLKIGTVSVVDYFLVLTLSLLYSLLNFFSFVQLLILKLQLILLCILDLQLYVLLILPSLFQLSLQLFKRSLLRQIFLSNNIGFLLCNSIVLWPVLWRVNFVLLLELLLVFLLCNFHLEHFVLLRSLHLKFFFQRVFWFIHLLLIIKGFQVVLWIRFAQIKFALVVILRKLDNPITLASWRQKIS